MPVSKSRVIARLFADAAREFADFPAVISEATIITYAQLLASGIGFARRFRALGVTRSSIVALNTGDMPASLSVMLATSLLGCRLVTASGLLAKQNFLHPTHFFRTPDAEGKKGVDFVDITAEWFTDLPERPFDEIAEFPCDHDPDDPWLILHTSGTTGKPKFIGLTHRIVADRTAAIAADFPTASVTCAMMFNATSRPFFARAIGVLLNGCTIVDGTSSAFWKSQGVNLVFCSPDQFETFLLRYGMSERFRKVEVSGARLDDRIARKLAAHFDTVVDIYGASETNKTFSNLVSVAVDGTVERRGQPLDSIVEIVDPAGNPCPPGKSGTVRVRNGYMIAGYLNSEEATRKNFQDGWFLPGDIASWGKHGELDILGRTDEIISFGGVKIDAKLIDAIIKSVPGVKDAASLRNPRADRHEIVAFVVFETGADRPNVTAAIQESYRSHTGLPCFLGRFTKSTPSHIPATDAPCVTSARQ